MINKSSIICLSLGLLLAGSVNAESFRYTYTLLSEKLPGNWQETSPEYGAWDNIGAPYSCSNWSPSTSTVGKGIAFTQSADNCSQNQTRWVQKYAKNNIDGTIKPVGERYDETRSVAGTDHRDAVGVLENWASTSALLTNWVDTNALYGCTLWSPDPSTYNQTSTFSQASSTCKTDQERQRQEREQENFTGEIRNVGEPVIESQSLSNQKATRNYSVLLGSWTNNGEKYGCANWSPEPSTVTIGQSFTQNATDCKQDQTRTRAESYADHKTGSTVAVSMPAEAQTLSNQTSTKTATGTKETWAAATPTYTAWTNTNALYACANWSPAGSSKTATGTFIQTSTDCKTDQARSRQDREQESTTLEYRNKGTPVAEEQTLAAQTATRNYTVTVGAWTNTGAKYACTNWSPASSTVTVGQNFTQTATDCKQDQTRTRSESYVDHKTGSTVAVTVPADTQALSNQTNTQTATGTKETWAATTATYTAWTNTNALYGCTNWSPAGSTKTATGTFTQTATDCKTDQTRNRQDREQETTTLAYRNKGAPVAETQILSSQAATRSYTVTLGAWSNSGAKYSCTNWSPAASTVTSGQTFTQTATDCKQDQTRTRDESYVDHKTGGSVTSIMPVEKQILSNQQNTQTATGTKVAKTCQYKSSYPSASNVELWNDGLTQIFWAGTEIVSGYVSMPYTKSGYRYTAGTLKEQGEFNDPSGYNYYYDRHEVCREAI